jgi:hypothetical protein
MPAPRFLGYQALLGEPKPINWQGVGQALWDSNLNAPIRGAYNLMNTPYEVLAGGPSPEMDQAVADSFDAAGGVTVGSMPIKAPPNSLRAGYAGAPDSLMGYSEKNPPKGYHKSNYPLSAEVVVDFGDGAPHRDAIRGMNKSHILERAKRNWPDAKKIEIIGDPQPYQSLADWFKSGGI